MKITRNNYEEYFLMYVDDELTEDQKHAVEEFALANTDLAEELEMLKETKLFANEEINFDKSSLYKNSGNIITAENAEEFFLLQIDNELEEKEQAELKTFLLRHTEKEAEFLMLKQTVLPKEKVEFSNKQILYRKEKDRRIIPFNWLKLSVAAAFVGVLGIIWFLIPHAKQENNVAKNFYVVKKVLPIISTESSNNNVQNTREKKVDNNSVASIEEKNNAAKNDSKRIRKNVASNNNQTIVHENKNKQTQTSNSKNDAVQNQQPSNNNNTNNQVAAVNNDNTNTAAQQETAEQRMADAERKLNDANQIFASNDNTKTQDESNIVHPAVYHELNTDEDDKGVYIGSVELNKNKVRSFLKKASRILVSKAKDNEEGDLKVANLDINTKTL